MTDATQLTDEFLFESASSPAEQPVSVSKGKSMSYVIDLNQGSYANGIVTLDATNQLNGSQGYASLRDAYVTVPYVVTLKNGAGDQLTAANTINQFIAGLKCNTTTIIDKAQIELNGKTIITPSGHLSHWNNLRAMTEWSDDDVKVYGPSAMMFPDDVYSIGYSDVASSGGDGYTNNNNAVGATLSNTASAATEWAFNSGFVKRQLANPPLVSANGSAAVSTKWPTMNAGSAQQVCTSTGKGCMVAGATTANATIATFYYLLRIRLVDIHPIFKTLDLVANPQLKLTLYFNTGNSTIAVSSSKTMSLTSTVTTQGSTCPVMITSASANNSMVNVLGSVATTLSLAWGVMGNSITTSGASQYYPYPTTRMWIPFYDLQPDKALAIVRSPKKKSRFLDYYVQPLTRGIGSGVSTTGPLNANFSIQLSASIKNAKYVCLIPYANSSAAGVNYATATNVDQFASPFDSAPWTCQSGSAITNFNVQIGNKWVFNAGSSYDFSGFLDEFSKISSIYGAMSHELANGLIDEDKWAYGQRMLIADVSRHTSKEVPTSILVSGTNSSSQSCDVLVLVAYEREITIDRITGEVESFT